MASDHRLIDIAALTPALRAQMTGFLRTDLKRSLTALADPSEGAAWAIHTHLTRLRDSLSATVPRWLRDDLIQARIPRSHGAIATLLFADVTGFTPLSSYLHTLGREGNHLLTQILNAFFAQVVAIAQMRGGDVLAFGGDAILVAFTGPDHATVATIAAWEMQQAIPALVLPPIPGRRASSGIQIKIGVASGPLVRVSVGTGDRQIPLALGRVLATTDAMANATDPGGVRLDVVAAALVDSSVDLVIQPDETAILVGLRGTPPMPAHPMVLPVPEDLPLNLLVAQIAAFARYQPARLLENLASTAQAVPGFGEQREVMSMFIHLSGLHDLADALGPQQAPLIADAAALVFREVFAAIEDYGGMLARADIYDDGHKVLALFGAPVAHEYDAYRAVRAALAVRNRLPDINVALAAFAQRHAYQPHTRDSEAILHARTGINAGLVFAGLIGAPGRYDYTVMGDSTNVAARIMSKGKLGQHEVVVSSAIHAHLSALLDAEGQFVRLKGIRDPVQIWSVQQVCADLPPRPSRDTPLIGRAPLLQTLQVVADALRRGEPRAILIQGEAGIGKTRMAAAFTALLDPAVRRVAVAPPGAVTSSYDLIRAILHPLCAIQISADAMTIRERVRALLGGQSAEQITRWWPALSFLLDLPDANLGLLGDSAPAQVRALAQAAQVVIEAAAQQAPLALFCEDLHEADSESLAVLDQILRLAWRGPIVFCGTLRPLYHLTTHAEHPAMQLGKAARSGLRGNAVTLELSALKERASGELLDLLLPNLAPEARTELLRYAGGNPLFLEVLAEEVQRRAWLRQGSGGWVLRDTLAALGVPAQVSGLIAANVDQLPFDVRRLACVAAAIAAVERQFPLWLLEEIADEREAVEAQLDLLERARLIIRTSDDQEDSPAEYRFRHALFQQAAYQLLAEDERQVAHQRIGRALDRFWTVERLERPAVLAYHCYEGRLWEPAMRYSLAAGQQAQHAYTNRTAYRFLRRARRLARQLGFPQQEADACEGLGAVLALRGRFQTARALLGRALRQSAVLDADATLWEAQARRRRLLALIGERTGDYRQAEADCRNGLVLAAQIGQPHLETARLYAQLAELLMRQSQFDSAAEACTQGLMALAQMDAASPGWLREHAALIYRRATIHGQRGHYTAAISELEHCLIMARQVGDQALLAATLHNLGVYLAGAGQAAPALERWHESIQIKEQIGDVAGRIQTINSQGAIYLNRSEHAQALDCFVEVRALCERLRFSDQLATALVNIGIIHYMQQEYSSAVDSLVHALDLFRTLTDADSQADCLYRLGDIALAQGDPLAAQRYGAEALAMTDTSGSLAYRSCALRVIGEVYLAQGQITEAAVALGESWQVQEHVGDPYDQTLILVALARLALAQGQSAAAQCHLQTGLDLARAQQLPYQIGLLESVQQQLDHG